MRASTACATRRYSSGASVPRMIRWLLALAIMAVGGVAAPASATPCTVTYDRTTIDFQIVNAPRDVPVGTRISNIITMRISYNCSSENMIKYVSTIGRAAKDPNNGNYFSSGLSGVGIVAISTDMGVYANCSGANPCYMSAVPVNSQTAPFRVPPNTAATGSFTVQWYLVKSAAITQVGPFNIGNVMEFQPTATVNPWGPATAIRVMANFNLPICSVLSSPIITLPKLAAAKFATVGHVDGATDFSLGISCPAGAPVRIFATLTDSLTPANRSNILSTRTGAGRAGGIGIQIRNVNGPISYGPDSSAAGNPGQFQISTMINSASTTALPLTFAYIRTGTVTPGTVQGVATITLSYQ